MTNLLNQRYRFIRCFGGGGMGNVSLAADTKLGDRLVAVKEMRQDQLKSPEEVKAAVQAFKQEVFMLAALRHQNLPRVYEHFEEAGNWYLVMDFIEGKSLEEYQKTLGGKLPIGEVLDIGIQLCTVLHYLHTRQPLVIFRDLKPSNVMRTQDGHIYLIDFGIARHFTPGKSHDTFLAFSRGYAAPEQDPYSAHLAQTTPQADIYSLVATLHHLLTGHQPKDNEPRVFDFAPLQSFDPSLPLALNTLIMQMVKKEVKDRPIRVVLVKAELQRISTTLGQASLQTSIHLPRSPSSSALPPPLKAVSPIAQSRTIPPAPVPSTPQGTLLVTYGGHRASVRSVAWSPNGTRIASGSADGTVQVWKAHDGDNVFTYKGHSSQVDAVAWSPDGTRIASGSRDGTVQVWNAYHGGPLFTYRGHSKAVLSVAWSPDGIRIASGSRDGSVQVWQAVEAWRRRRNGGGKVFR